MGANVETGTPDETPLSLAVANGSREIAELLLSAGADPNRKSKAGLSPLEIARLSTFDDLVERLYRTQGPQAVGKLELRPVEDFNRVLGEVVDGELLPLGWSRSSKGLQWSRPAQAWAEQVIDFQPLRNGVGARWGLRLSFVPALKKRRGGTRELDFSYAPIDYQRDVSPWSLSRFATEDELRSDGRALVQRVLPEAGSLDGCCRDLHSLLMCFEDKKARKHVRLGFHHYPHEILAYATVLGLTGRQDEGLQQLDAAFDRLKTSPAEQERFRQALMNLWQKGI